MLDRPLAPTQASAPLRPERSQPGMDGEPLDGAAVLAILRRRKWLFLATALMCPLVAVVAITRLTPRYTAVGTLLYDPSEYKPRELQSILRVDPITEAVMASQAEILRGLPVVEQIARQLHLDTNPEFNPALRYASWSRRIFAAMRRTFGIHTATGDPAIAGPNLEPGTTATLAEVQAALTAMPVKASHVLEVSFTAEDPVIAAAAVNDAMDVYVKSQLGMKYGAAMRARTLLEQRRDELRQEVQRQEELIAQYRAKHGLAEGMHSRLDSEQISVLSENLEHAQSALAEAEGKLGAASGRAGAAAQAAIAPSVVQFRARRSQLAAELQSSLGRLGSRHPDVLAIQAQMAAIDRTISAETARVVAAIEADVHANRARVDALQRNLDDQRTLIARDAQAQVPLNAMLRDAEAARSQLQAVLDRIQQTAQQPTIETVDAHEISLALVPTRPSFPPTGRWMAASSALGVMLGLLVVYVRELADNTFHSGDDLRSVLGLPCLALLPCIPTRILKGNAVEDYAARKPHSALAEQIRALRAGLSLWPDRPRVVAISAAHPREGKTAVTRALARLAAMNGERVVVLDCDFRRPSHSQAAETKPGLIDYLRDRASLADVMSRDAATGVDFGPSGKAEVNALGLLMSATMARLLQVLRDEYDLVLLDTPPAEAITDARIVAGLADATLFCVRWRATSRQVALHALELLEGAHARVVGAALTQVDVNVHVRSGYADAQVYHPRYGGYFRE